MKSIVEPHVRLIGTVMDMQLQRQNVIMGNIANVNTPKYKPRELEFEASVVEIDEPEFEAELQSALNLDAKGKVARTAEGHMPAAFDPDGFGPEWSKQFTPRVVHGEDRVNLDKEMVKMAKNNLQYTALAQITKSSFEGIRNIITEGSK